MQQEELKIKYLDVILNFIWSQWTSLGVCGYSESNKSLLIDPECLLLFSLKYARYDQRLFDEILDWLDKNERFINVSRLKSILSQVSFTDLKVLRATSFYVSRKNKTLKWKGLFNLEYSKKEENLFLSKDGKPLSVFQKEDEVFKSSFLIRNEIALRELSSFFPPQNPSNLIFKLRSILGVNSRAEIFSYLLSFEKATIKEIADHTSYAWRSIQDVLFDLSKSGLVSSPLSKKNRTYHLHKDEWFNLLLNSKEVEIKYPLWKVIFSFLDDFFETLNNPSFFNSSDLLKANELKTLVEKHLDYLDISLYFRNPSTFQTEDYSAVFYEDLDRFLFSFQ